MKKSENQLADILFKGKVIPESQLSEGWKFQNYTEENADNFLIKPGDISEKMLVQSLVRQVEIGQQNNLLLPSVTNLLPKNLIKQHRVVPIKKEDEKLIIAMADPKDIVVLDDLQMATGLRIVPIKVSKEEIDATIKKLFAFQDIVNQAIFEYETQSIANDEFYDLDEVGNTSTGEMPTVRIVNSLIRQAIEERASDIHIEPREKHLRVRYRIDGVLKNVMDLPKQSHAFIVSRIKVMADMDIAEKRIPLDGRIKVRFIKNNIDLRISTLPTIYGEKVVIRVLDKSGAIATLDKLGLSNQILPIYRQMAKRSYGMVLITGPTGSGKTTTLYSTMLEINSPEKNIVTIEDPVEYVLDDINQIRVNMKAGLTFSSGLRAILRQDPDIVLIGEIRDGETASIAVRAATTGHLVLSTLHTNDAAGALPRLVDMGVEPFLVASTVIGIMAQRLVRLVCPFCKEAYILEEDCLERKFINIPPEEQIILYRGTGCPHCSYTGYRGRTAIQELLPVGDKQQELILNRASADRIKNSAVAEGMLTLTQDGIKKALQGLTTIDEVMRVATTTGL